MKPRLFLVFGTVLTLSAAAHAQASPISAIGSAVAAQACALNQPEPALPLHTSGAQIVDANGKNFKLSGVAWYGAESEDYIVGGLQLEPINAIARRIRCLGFNAVRLPWSNEMYESNPRVPDYAVAANPQLKGLHALAVYRQVVEALAAQGLLVILDNHNSNAEWCCGNDGNDLWYNADYPESAWIADWKGMVTRFKDVPQVIAADLRNEPRLDATWGGSPTTDWHAAAERGGAAVLATNKNLLIMVEGVSYSLDLTGVAALPVKLPVANKLVYSPHDYPFDHSNYASAADLAAQYDPAWGYIVTPGQPYTAPIWLGEFGNCHTASLCVTDTAAGSSGLWFAGIRQYIQQKGISWSWWAINGTQTTGAGRTYGGEEIYGVLNPFWNAPALPNEFNPTDNVADALQTIAQPLPAEGEAALPPLVAIASPVPGNTIVSGTALMVTANANAVAGGTDAVAKVVFYADGNRIGAVSSAGKQSPYSFAWMNVPPGAHTLQAKAVTQQGRSALSQEIPVQATNYAATRPAYTNGIAVDFVSYAVTQMAASEQAGVVPQTFWNQAGIANNGTLPGLLDANGKATTASVSWTSPNTYFTTIPDQAGNDRMMKGYLDNSDTAPNTVSVAGLPKKFATYDVVAYFDGGNEATGGLPGPTRTSLYRLTSTDASGVHGCQAQGEEGSTITGADVGGVDFAGTFLQAANGSAGNYILFLNCTGSSFQLAPVHGQSSNGEVRAPINGVQILAHP